MAVQVSSPAPPFKVKAYRAEVDAFEDISLESLKGPWVCLFFFPAAFSALTRYQ